LPENKKSKRSVLQPHKTPADKPNAVSREPYVWELVDFHYWAAMDLWRLPEAAVLLLKINPEVNERSPHLIPDRFERELTKINALIESSQQSEKLDVYAIPPRDFLSWAEAKGFDIPKELKKEVVEIDENYKDLDQAKALVGENKWLKMKLSEADKQEPAKTGRQSDQTKKLNSARMVAAAMAAEKYKYDPLKSHTSVVSNIKKTIKKHGGEISENTLRKLLANGAELLDLGANEEADD
jgi:hypothetical protein